MRAKHSCCKVAWGNTSLNLNKMLSERATLPSRTLMCSWKVSLLSKIIPTYFVLWTVLKIEESLVTLIKEVERFSLGEMMRIFILEKLPVSLLTQHQFWRFLNSFFILFSNWIKFSAFTDRHASSENNLGTQLTAKLR